MAELTEEQKRQMAEAIASAKNKLAPVVTSIYVRGPGKHECDDPRFTVVKVE